MVMRSWLVMLGGISVLVALAGHTYARVYLRPRSLADEVYHEFEDQDPQYRRYLCWYRCTFGLASIGSVLLLLALVLF